jgi:hypothetical protein
MMPISGLIWIRGLMPFIVKVDYSNYGGQGTGFFAEALMAE